MNLPVGGAAIDDWFMILPVDGAAIGDWIINLIVDGSSTCDLGNYLIALIWYTLDGPIILILIRSRENFALGKKNLTECSQFGKIGLRLMIPKLSENLAKYNWKLGIQGLSVGTHPKARATLGSLCSALQGPTSVSNVDSHHFPRVAPSLPRMYWIHASRMPKIIPENSS